MKCKRYFSLSWLRLGCRLAFLLISTGYLRVFGGGSCLLYLYVFVLAKPLEVSFNTRLLYHLSIVSSLLSIHLVFNSSRASYHQIPADTKVGKRHLLVLEALHDRASLRAAHRSQSLPLVASISPTFALLTIVCKEKSDPWLPAPEVVEWRAIELCLRLLKCLYVVGGQFFAVHDSCE